MRGNKAYSNVTVTKRVDYDGGTHRPGKALAGQARVCGGCGAVYIKRRWVTKDDPRAAGHAADAASTTCPACHMQQNHLVGGYLTVKGDFFLKHREEIETLLRREAERAAEDNPLGRILTWDRKAKDTLIVETSTEHLVERLGRALHSAYKGEIDFGFSHNNKFARAQWSRN